jgi:hypothetical protein
MDVEVFSLCDAATVEGGKLNILGAFDTIMVSKAGAVHPHCTVAMRLRFNSIEGNEHKIAVKLVDVDGSHVIPSANGVITIKFAQGQRTSSANLVLNLQGLKLAKFGEYSIELQVGGKNVASLPFFVREQKKQPPAK